MNFKQQLTWRNLDQQYAASTASQIARYAVGLRFEHLPDDVTHHAKRSLLDGLGNAIGGIIAPGLPACISVARALGGPAEATIWGAGERVGAASATLVNAFMMRFLEYNDVGGGNHGEEAIPALLAIAERQGSSGENFLLALVLAYEIGLRTVLAAPGGYAGYDKHGWSTDARGGINIPPAIGKLLGLDEAQTAHAIAICASRGVPLGILDADKEENSMAKNLRFGFITREAITACLLAREGFTGPLRVIEGDGGYRDGVLRGEMDLAALVDFSGWRIRDTRFKTLCVNGSSEGHVKATMEIVIENDLKPSDIERVRIRASAREARHTTALAKKYPRNAETGDHSACFANAFAIKFRNFGPDSADPERFTDPDIVDLIERITVEHDSELGARTRIGVSEVFTKDGRRFTKRCEGLGEVWSDERVEAKFLDTARRHIGERHARDIIDCVWTIDRAENLDKLAKLMVFRRNGAAK
jgi:2-methylcitrate dehydratase